MFHVNSNFEKLQGNYLFSEIARRVAAYRQENKGADIISLGIGDVTRPLVPAVLQAMDSATAEMASEKTFMGYGPEQGYAFLREAIRDSDYQLRGIDIAADEIFVSDGSKCDTGNIQELFSKNCRIAVTDPVYPAYVDTNVMAGRTGEYDPKLGQYSGLTYLPATEENGFCPPLPQDGSVDVVYLCSPNNPTGVAMKRDDLEMWVNWANKNKALILFDGAYERYITEDDVPHSIYEIEGAKSCAIEFRSFSKTAGFTGLRCAYTVVPKDLMGQDEHGRGLISLNAMWLRRHTTKFNGVAYIVQRAAAAVYSNDGKQQVADVIAYYLDNVKTIRQGLEKIGITCYGGISSPYVWLKTPDSMKSWDFFDKLLFEAHVVGTPGSGFGSGGEGYFRLTGFGTKENTQKAIERLAGLSS